VISTHSFEIPVADFLGMKILNAKCNIERLDKLTMITKLKKISYQTNTIVGITVRIHTIPTSQEFHYVPVFHPGRHEAKSGFQGVLQKVDAIEG
jgi:hypothetical protein